jgi:hypothetical protein
LMAGNFPATNDSSIVAILRCRPDRRHGPICAALWSALDDTAVRGLGSSLYGEMDGQSLELSHINPPHGRREP